MRAWPASPQAASRRTRSAQTRTRPRGSRTGCRRHASCAGDRARRPRGSAPRAATKYRGCRECPTLVTWRFGAAIVSPTIPSTIETTARISARPTPRLVAASRDTREAAARRHRRAGRRLAAPEEVPRSEGQRRATAVRSLRAIAVVAPGLPATTGAGPFLRHSSGLLRLKHDGDVEKNGRETGQRDPDNRLHASGVSA